jgi:hypothetical protein
MDHVSTLVSTFKRSIFSSVSLCGFCTTQYGILKEIAVRKAKLQYITFERFLFLEKYPNITQ